MPRLPKKNQAQASADVNYDRLQRLMIELMLGTAEPQNEAEVEAVRSLKADVRLAGPGTPIEFPLD